MVKALGQRPVPRADEWFTGIGSHDRGPFARVVRAVSRATTRLQPAFSSRNCLWKGGNRA
jgi:hypothetical protein